MDSSITTSFSNNEPYSSAAMTFNSQMEQMKYRLMQAKEEHEQRGQRNTSADQVHLHPEFYSSTGIPESGPPPTSKHHQPSGSDNPSPKTSTTSNKEMRGEQYVSTLTFNSQMEEIKYSLVQAAQANKEDAGNQSATDNVNLNPELYSSSGASETAAPANEANQASESENAPPKPVTTKDIRERIANFKCCEESYAKAMEKAEEGKSKRKRKNAKETPEEPKTKRGGCILQFTEDEVYELQMQMGGLKEREKDGIIKGLLMALDIRTGTFTQSSRRKLQQPRKRSRVVHYQIAGRQVCCDAFRHLLGISKQKLSAVKIDFLANGVKPRKTKSGGRNHKAFNSKETEHAVTFLTNLSEERGEVIPGRIPGFQHADIRILPSGLNKRTVYELYVESTREHPDIRTMSGTSFQKTWKLSVPYIILSTREMSDSKKVFQSKKKAASQHANQSQSQSHSISHSHSHSHSLGLVPGPGPGPCPTLNHSHSHTHPHAHSHSHSHSHSHGHNQPKEFHLGPDLFPF